MLSKIISQTIHSEFVLRQIITLMRMKLPQLNISILIFATTYIPKMGTMLCTLPYKIVNEISIIY